MFRGWIAVMCCAFVAGCDADRAREARTDTSAAIVRAAPGADSVPTVSSAAITGAKDTTIVLGRIERDMTGDGQPEVLRLLGVGQSTDSLDVTFVIESPDEILFQEQLEPLTRTVGFDAGRRRLSPAEHRAQLEEFDDSFFTSSRFMQPDEFVEKLRSSAPGHIPRIPDVIARARARELSSSGGPLLDSAGAAALWEEIQRSGVTVFNYSPGGDATTAIAWSARHLRFYPLLECC